MYPDIITPKSHPELLQDITYDPFNLMPKLPADKPCVYTSAERFKKVQQRIQQGSIIDKSGLDDLQQECRMSINVSEIGSVTRDEKLLDEALTKAFTNILIFHINNNEKHKETALNLFRIYAKSSMQQFVPAKAVASA
jgi:hypothetical protein